MPLLTPSSSEALAGKRILLIGRDYGLLRTLTDLLRSADCTVFGIVGRSADGSVWRPDSVVDAAVVDMDRGNSTDVMLMEHLKDRGIPLLLMYSPTLGAPPAQLAAEHSVHKPFVEATFLEALMRTVLGARTIDGEPDRQ